MFRLNYLSAIVLLIGAVTTLGENITASDPSLLINGIEARIEDFPYVVSMRRNRVHIGGGAIVSATWAVSAAHILLGCPPTQLSLRAGSDQRLIGGSLHNANSILIHNSFNHLNLDFNMAMIGAMEPFTFSTTVQPIRLDVQGIFHCDHLFCSEIIL